MDDVIHHFDIGSGVRHAPGHDGQFDQLRAGLSRDQARHLFGELRFAHDDWNVLRLHGGNQLLDVARRRVNQRLQFNRPEIFQTET